MKLSNNFTNGPVFGGFFGYNKWDQLVIGFDVGYKYALSWILSTAQTRFSSSSSTMCQSGRAPDMPSAPSCHMPCSAERSGASITATRL